MIEFTIETTIDRPPEDVFDYLTDPAKLPSWQTNTVSAETVEPGPLRIGSRLREVHRAPGGKEIGSVVEVSEYERPSTFGLKVVEGTPIHLRVTLEPAPNGTLMLFKPYGKLKGAARLTEPLLGLALKRQFKRDCANLKRQLES